MKRVNPYVNFRGQTEQAFGFYRSVFGGEAPSFVRYRDMGGGAPHEDDLVAHVELAIGADTMLMGSDIPESRADAFRLGGNVQIYLAAESLAEGQRLFDALASGGAVTMPFEKTTWAERFGACVDRFGVRWMVDYTGDVRFGEA